MKIKELIEKLKEYDEEMEVVTYDSEWGYEPIKIEVHLVRQEERLVL